MQRFEIFPTVAGLVLLLAGAGLGSLAPNLGWAVHWRNVSYGFSWPMMCNAAATIFCAIATICSIHQIPFNRSVLLWQFWLSVVCVVLCALGQAMFYRMVGSGVAPNVATSLVAIVQLPSMVIPIFVLTQLLFLAEFARALVRMSSV